MSLVDRIIVYMRTLMAAELSWPDVAELLERRRERSKKGPQTVNFSVPRNTLTRALGLAD